MTPCIFQTCTDVSEETVVFFTFIVSRENYVVLILRLVWRSKQTDRKSGKVLVLGQAPVKWVPGLSRG